MKQRFLAVCLTVGALLALTGCGESSTPSTSSPPNPPAGAANPAPKPVVETMAKSVQEAAQVVGTEATKAADATKAGLEDAARAVQKAVTEAGPAAQQAFNELVADVKKLIADGKGSEAVQRIQSALSGLKLTPEQQKLIEDLKTQAQAALSRQGVDAAAKAAADLLKPKATGKE